MWMLSFPLAAQLESPSLHLSILCFPEIRRPCAAWAELQTAGKGLWETVAEISDEGPVASPSPPSVREWPQAGS